jgi:hypothetical protein
MMMRFCCTRAQAQRGVGLGETCCCTICCELNGRGMVACLQGGPTSFRGLESSSILISELRQVKVDGNLYRAMKCDM